MSQPPDPEDVRVGNLEREDAMRVLGEHFSAGRLQVHEYDERVGHATAATTRSELQVLFADLPAPYPPFMAPAVWSAPPPAPFPTHPGGMHPPPGYPPAYPPPTHYPVQPMGYSDKSKTTAGLLQILLPFGAGRFYTGHAGMAVGMLLGTMLTCGALSLWSIVDGIILLVNGGTDNYGRRLRD
ncbi:DUF1707 domain-containing protein [Actinokineospora sp. G85]|uniref:DUF1707 domain-containing protein n=1 Tax=Actinokineospora sp. G85 TaxID=3406626 RepID=UPI003C7103AE